MTNCLCFRCPSPTPAEDLCERRIDYGLSALMITGIVLLIIGACIQNGYIPLSGTATNYFFGFGGALFGVGFLGLFIRSCCGGVVKSLQRL
ncbi:MAG: hypothetical protein JJU12_00940 [Chlamydiales bacterium]|nr:hypothetical protein [Chlamydiales bacterium]